MAGYRPRDINIVAAWDVDRRKVGKDVSEAIFARPNCTTVFCDHVPPTGTTVLLGRILDGVADHMEDYPIDRTFDVAAAQEPDRAEVVPEMGRASCRERVCQYV